jgi:hypothetical protein
MGMFCLARGRRDKSCIWGVVERDARAELYIWTLVVRDHEFVETLALVTFAHHVLHFQSIKI